VPSIHPFPRTSALLALVVLLPSAAVEAQHRPSTRAPEDAPSQLQLTAPDEPGEPLVVEGVVTDAQDRPVAGASLYVYQTGADGLYGPEGNRNPRLRGYLRSDEEGRWELSTIMPGGYPGGGVAPHIHLHAAAPGAAGESVLELVFEGDPRISERMRRSPMFTVGRVTRGEDGVDRVRWEVRLAGE
jgi:protocatechuate 3,4-dioxygenase beta subunit